MLSYSLVYALVLATLAATHAALPNYLLTDTDETNPFDCLTNSLQSSSVSLYCRGTRVLRNVIHNLAKSDKPIVIVRGLEIVPTKDYFGDSGTADNSTSATFDAADAEDDSFLGRFSAYLRSHELNIKFSDLLADESERYAAFAIARDSEQRDGVNLPVGSGAEEARKKDKGQGIILTVALMFAKILAVMGLSGIGALAIKALGVGMAALLLSGIVGLKSLTQKANENTHSVQYVNADVGHHHIRRRRRSAVKRT